MGAFWLVWSLDHPFRRFETEADARAGAEEAARKSPGVAFFLLEPRACVVEGLGWVPIGGAPPPPPPVVIAPAPPPPPPRPRSSSNPFAGADLSKLTNPRQIRAVQLRNEGKTRQEIATALGTTLGTVGVLHWAAKRRLGIETIGKFKPHSRMRSGPPAPPPTDPDEPISFEEFEPPPAPPPVDTRPVITVDLDEDDEQPAPPALTSIRGGADGVIHKVIAARNLTREERRAGALIVYPEDVERPRTRGDCAGGARPCPYVSCSSHLYLDVDRKTGSIKVNFPHLEVWEMKESCALDVADRDGATLEQVGGYLNLTRERVRQIEGSALRNAHSKHPERKR